MNVGLYSRGPATASAPSPATTRAGRLPSLMVREQAPFLALALVLVAAAWAYWDGLYGPLLLDDYPQLEPLLDASRLHGDWLAYLISNSGPLGRPVSMASFLLNSLVSGGDLFWWKFTNLLVHLACGVSAAGLAAHLWSPREAVPSVSSRYAGVLVGALWLLHPLQVSTVLYTVQRMAQLSTLFVLAGLLAYVIGRKRQILHPDGAGGHLAVASCFAVFLPLALLSKENGALLLPLALLVELLLFRFEGGMRVRRALIACYAVLLAVPAAAGAALLAVHYHDYLLAHYAVRPFTLYERVLTEFRALWLYLFELVLPIQRNMAFFHDDFVLSRGWLEPPDTLAAFVGLLLLAAAGWLARRRAPLVALGIGFFFIGHLIESTILPLELVHEHRNYLPSFGVFLALCAGFGPLIRARGLRTGIALVLLCSCALLTSFRAQTWSSEFMLYNYALRNHPHSQRAAAQVAQTLIDAGLYDRALAVLQPFDGDGPALQRLYLRCRRRRALGAADLHRVAAGFSPPVGEYAASGLMEIAREGITGECRLPPRPMLSLLDRALALPVTDPSSRYKLLIYRAHYLWRLERVEDALATVEDAVRLRPGDPVPLFMASEWMISRREPARARGYYARAVSIARHARLSYAAFITRIGRELDSPTAGSSNP